MFLGCNDAYPLRIVSNLTYVNAVGEFTCENGKVLFYLNGSFPASNQTICGSNAKWNRLNDLECWIGNYIQFKKNHTQCLKAFVY